MDRFADAAAYEGYIGRWSRRVAVEFLDWLAVPPGARWLDVGCGSGALVDAIVARAAPAVVYGVDRSAEFVEATAARLAGDSRVRLFAGDAESLPAEVPGDLDAAVSALVLNFVPEPARALAEMARCAPLVAVYVWDYAEGMEMLRRFWDAAIALDPAAAALDEGVRFPVCRADALAALFGASLTDVEVEVRPIDVETTFRDFDDLWSPFLGAQGPAPGYVAGLDEDRRAALRSRLRASLGGGPIHLRARAWAARGRRRSR